MLEIDEPCSNYRKSGKNFPDIEVYLQQFNTSKQLWQARNVLQVCFNYFITAEN